MDAAINPRAENVARIWLWTATVVCPAAPILVPLLGAHSLRPIALLPMVNCVAVWAFLFFQARQAIAESMRLRLKILAGRSNGDISSEVRRLRAAVRPLYMLIFWPWLLIPLTWAVLVFTKPAV